MLTQNEIISLLGPGLKKPFVFLETAAFDSENTTSFLFKDFTKIITFNGNDDIDFFFQQTEDCLEKKSWACGFFSYEFGYFLEPALFALKGKNNFPLAWLACCKEPIRLAPQKPSATYSGKNRRESFRVKNLKPNITYTQYAKAIRKIKYCLANGTNYQTNFTFKIKFGFKGDILSFYLGLRAAQPTAYAALINTGEHFVISLSPELFFRLNGNQIITRPMKGTFSRGTTLWEDKINENKFITDKKIIAENLMIVDLLRNDLGKVAREVWVPKLFSAEKYPTLFQMTSTIQAQIRNRTTFREIFSSLFPSGSVTGAPKIKTMEIIKKLEQEPRNIYTGAIGYFSPDKNACFNVAIRTVLLSQGKGEMGVGGGIVSDSSAKKEYTEALLKAKFLTEANSGFSLIESILHRPWSGYYLMASHLNRLKKSAQYFSIPMDFGKLKNELAILGKKLKSKGGKFKIRVLVNSEGNFSIKQAPLDELKLPVKIRISRKKVEPRDVFLYHKTTRRKLYDAERKKAQTAGCFEVIFFNKYGELTEGSITNIFILKNEILYTPPVKCGLLNGVLRQHLLKNRRAKERILYLRDLLEAAEVYIGNSVRSLLKAEISLADLRNSSKIKMAKS